MIPPIEKLKSTSTHLSNILTKRNDFPSQSSPPLREEGPQRPMAAFLMGVQLDVPVEITTVRCGNVVVKLFFSLFSFSPVITYLYIFFLNSADECPGRVVSFFLFRFCRF